MNQYDPHTVYLIFGPNTKVCLVSDVRDAIEKHRKSLEADNPESSTLGHETYDDELYAIFGAPAKPAQEPVTKQYDGTEHMKELLGIAPPEAARRFWCADCRVGAMGEEEALAHHGITGHLVVEDSGSAGGGV